MKINNSIKSITTFYNKLSPFGKILLFIALLLILIVFFNSINKSIVKEGFEQSDSFLFKKGNDVYDDFYSGVYDYLVFNTLKNEYEVGSIINSSIPTETSVI